jgi:hypothetical protein
VFVLRLTYCVIWPGGHRTAHLEFNIEAVKHGIEPADAPCRLKIVFGEILNDVTELFEEYRYGRVLITGGLTSHANITVLLHLAPGSVRVGFQMK